MGRRIEGLQAIVGAFPLIEILDELRTCDDVWSLGTRGICEGPRMDYKEVLVLTERGTLTAGAKK